MRQVYHSGSVPALSPTSRVSSPTRRGGSPRARRTARPSRAGTDEPVAQRAGRPGHGCAR
ncbi:hypothetical protein H7827_03285 [Streptomyces sp. JH002]|uniref:hypothetical protein n=1 Tax=Streptomyces sp. JH002 TaxID=2763259 RepID=UPI003D802F6E